MLSSLNRCIGNDYSTKGLFFLQKHFVKLALFKSAYYYKLNKFKYCKCDASSIKELLSKQKLEILMFLRSSLKIVVNLTNNYMSKKYYF